MPQRSLPRSIDELKTLMSQFAGEESLKRGSEVVVESDDIVISTYAKSGTTWLQQIAHQLRSGGDMDFEEISVVVPWLGVAYDMGIDPTIQRWRPRLFKAHKAWDDVPKGGRIITAFRAPEAVLRSFYRFFSGSFFEEGAISLEEFTHEWFLQGTGSGLYHDHIVSFWPHVEDEAVLALSYEDMVAVPDRVVEVVAVFMGIDDPSVITAATRNSSRSAMVEHVARFDDHVLSAAITARTGYPVGGLAKVHSTPADLVVTEDLRDALQAKWNEIVTPGIGFEDYTAFREALPDPLGVRS